MGLIGIDADAAAVRLYGEWPDGDGSCETSLPPARQENRMHLRVADLACGCPARRRR